MRGDMMRDGRVTMRIVFANAVADILRMPAGPNGRIPDGTVLAITLFEATAHPWIRDDAKFIEELEASKDPKLPPDARTLARWTAVLAGLQRAQMLDKARTPYDNVDEEEEEEVA